MNHINRRYWRMAALLLLTGMLSTSCSTLMQAKLLTVTIAVVDENDQPITGAIVESSNGQQSTTGSDGKVKLKFSSIGIHAITVIAQDRAPATLSITMPVDMGKTKTARLGKTVDMSVSLNITGNINLNMLGITAGALYPFIFQALFTYNGYNLELAPFEPGEWTEWISGDEGDQSVMHKAFLKRLANGQEWWQVSLSDDDGEDLMMEVLFSKGRQSVRRLRQRMGDGEAEEVPVSEGWYTAPIDLTPESLEASVQQKGVSVKVPTGTYTADILEFGSLGSGSIRMWRAKGVPGGLVKIETLDPDGDVAATSVLKATGKGAQTELDSY